MSTVDAADFPQALVELTTPGCVQCDECRRFAGEIMTKLAGRYIGQDDAPPPITAAYLPLADVTYDDYVARARKKNKGNAVRDALRAERKGFVVRPFPYRLYVPDICGINHSMEYRCGRPMSAAYRRDVIELGGYPQDKYVYQPPGCPVHYDMWWGCFVSDVGHSQGDIVTDERLVGYIRLRRLGDVVHYAQLLGHGEYLRQGVMNLLHFQIIKWLCAGNVPEAAGVRHLFYAGYFQGTEGLRFWKAKMLMQPVNLMTSAWPTHMQCPQVTG